MTVEKLIEKLKGSPAKAEVYIGYESYRSAKARSVEIFDNGDVIISDDKEEKDESNDEDHD